MITTVSAAQIMTARAQVYCKHICILGDGRATNFILQPVPESDRTGLFDSDMLFCDLWVVQHSVCACQKHAHEHKKDQETYRALKHT